MTNRLKVAFVLQWIIGILTTLTIAGGSFWLSHVEGEIDILTGSNLVQVGQISRLEANFFSTDKRLDRIEHKLDILLQRNEVKRH